MGLESVSASEDVIGDQIFAPSSPTCQSYLSAFDLVPSCPPYFLPNSFHQPVPSHYISYHFFLFRTIVSTMVLFSPTLLRTSSFLSFPSDQSFSISTFLGLAESRWTFSKTHTVTVHLFMWPRKKYDNEIRIHLCSNT